MKSEVCNCHLVVSVGSYGESRLPLVYSSILSRVLCARYGDTAMSKSYQNLCLMVFMSAILWSYRSKVWVSRVNTLIR